MRHKLQLGAMSVIDPGSVIKYEKFDMTNIVATKETVPDVELVKHYYNLLREEAFKRVADRHCQVFQYEQPQEVIEVFKLLCGPYKTTPKRGSSEAWRAGDVCEPEVIEDSPEVKAANSLPEILSAALTEMMRNIYRRLHGHEYPGFEQVLAVFQQATQPSQFPSWLLLKLANQENILQHQLLGVVQSRPEFWRSGLLDLCSQWVAASPGEPEAKQMQIAGLYNQIKEFFNNEEEETEPEKTKKREPRELSYKCKKK